MENEHKKASPGKIALAVAAIVVLLAALIGLVVSGMDQPAQDTASASALSQNVKTTKPRNGNPEDETAKGSYTVSDRKAASKHDVVVATMGDATLTNGQLQVFYWIEVQSFLNTYGTYAPMFGLDYTQDFDTQVCTLSDNNCTWQQFFLLRAVNTWRNYQAMANEAQANGYQVSEEIQLELASVPDMMEQNGLMYGFESGDAFLAANVGAGANMEDYVHYMSLYYNGAMYFDSLCEANLPTDADVEAYFAEHEAEYEEQGVTRKDKYVNVRHVLIMPEGATSANIRTETFDDAAWEASKVKAEELLAQFEEGGITEEAFGEIAKEHSQDGSAADGGLYTDVAKGQMVEEFEAWCFDETRQAGDYGIVKTMFGYHLMYYVSDRPAWTETVESDMIDQMSQDLMNEILDRYTMEVDYPSVVLGYVSLTGEVEEKLFSEENVPVLIIAGVSLLGLIAAAYVFREKEF